MMIYDEATTPDAPEEPALGQDPAPSRDEAPEMDPEQVTQAMASDSWEARYAACSSIAARGGDLDEESIPGAMAFLAREAVDLRSKSSRPLRGNQRV